MAGMFISVSDSVIETRIIYLRFDINNEISELSTSSTFLALPRDAFVVFRL